MAGLMGGGGGVVTVLSISMTAEPQVIRVLPEEEVPFGVLSARVTTLEIDP